MKPRMSNRRARAATHAPPPRILENVLGEAIGHPLGRFMHRASRQVSVPRGALRPAVPQEFPDHRQAFAERERA